MREKFSKLDKMEMSIWECCELLNEVVDDSDPDLDEPQIQHLLQSAEAIRQDYPDQDWLHLTALIHGNTLHYHPIRSHHRSITLHNTISRNIYTLYSCSNIFLAWEQILEKCSFSLNSESCLNGPLSVSTLLTSPSRIYYTSVL